MSRFIPHRFYRLLLASLLITLISGSVASASSGFIGKGTVYQTGHGTADYRNISTLNDFTRLVYKDRWLNIRADYVLEQLARFAGAARSPALREIWRDILLGDFAGLRINAREQQAALMAERIRLLNRLGYFDEAVRLYTLATALQPVPENIAAQGVEAMALGGSADGACLEVYMAANHLQKPDWLRDKALCAIYFGDKALAKKLYEQVKAESGSGFRTVYQMLNKETAKAIHVGIPPLWRTLLLARNATVTPEALKQADPMTLAALAINKRVPLETRLVAASRAADAGTIGSDQLRKLYETRHPANSGLEGIITAAKENKPMPQWDYYAAARFVFDGNSRARIVQNAVGHTSPVTGIKSHVYSWIVDKLTLQVKDLGWFAKSGYSVLATTNRLSSARLYYDAGHLENTEFALLDALLQGEPWSESAVGQWKKSMEKSYKDKAGEKIKSMMQLVAAYDRENKLALHLESVQPPQNPETFALFRESGRRGGRGLTLVSALNFIGGFKLLKDIPQDQFIDIIDNMTKEGLFRERKKLTLEFLIQTML